MATWRRHLPKNYCYSHTQFIPITLSVILQLPCLSFCPCPYLSVVLVCVLQLLSVFAFCNILLGTASVALYNQCCANRAACCSLLVGNVCGRPGCIVWGLWQYCLSLHPAYQG
jgi:hypothetical protein